ncbi:hypothetical protein TYRP_001085 [Tyrophagus putrescentiae]|nr:hypothetical protein TYRP_001085 [Tyrophagus putrescentiae]
MSISPEAAHPPYLLSSGIIQMAGHNCRPAGIFALTSTLPYRHAAFVRMRPEVKLRFNEEFLTDPEKSSDQTNFHWGSLEANLATMPTVVRALRATANFTSSCFLS